MLPSKLRQNYDPTLVKVLTNRLLKILKLQENCLVAEDLVPFNLWNWLLWS
jgi:hypothetical protein